MHLSAAALFALVALTAVTSSADAACARSTVKGYNYSVPLNTKTSTGSFKLHWRVAGKKIFFAIQALPSSGATSGWVSVGWSPKGDMDDSDAVVGNLAGSKPVKAYFLQNSRTQSVTTSFAIGSNPTVVKNSAGLFVTFVRLAGSGSVPISLTASNNLIYAWSKDNTKAFKNHGKSNRGEMKINFSCKS